MSFKLVVRSEAEKDIAFAVLRYERDCLGIGNYFMLCLDATIQQIERHPLSVRPHYKKFRRALVSKFPYGVFYVVYDDIVSVIAVLDLRQDPDGIEAKLK